MVDLNILRPLIGIEAQHQVDAVSSTYPTFIRVFQPHKPFNKLLPDLEAQDITDQISNPNISLLETNLERSIRRTRKNIKDIAFCNPFNHFATFTVAVDRYNLDKSKSKLTNWFKNEQKRKGKFEYLVVPEFHKDKKALHFHALLKDYPGVLKQSQRDDGRPIKARHKYIYEYPSYNSGFNSVELIDSDIHSITKVGFYLQKYITKDMPVLFGQNRYWASHGLKRPKVIINPQPWYKVAEPDRIYENEFGKILEFDGGKNVLVDIFLEASQP